MRQDLPRRSGAFTGGQRNAHLPGLRHPAGAPIHRRGAVRAGADTGDNPQAYAGIKYTVSAADICADYSENRLAISSVQSEYVHTEREMKKTEDEGHDNQ